MLRQLKSKFINNYINITKHINQIVYVDDVVDAWFSVRLNEIPDHYQAKTKKFI